MTTRIWFSSTAFLLSLLITGTTHAQSSLPKKSAETSVAVGPEFDTTHVYVAPQDFDTFVSSFIATLGGTPSAASVVNVLPVPSSTKFQSILCPVGSLSVFAYQTGIPYPFGQERTGYLVADMDAAIKRARAAGAYVIVQPFKDAIGRDAVIEWPGGLKMQLYWHVKPSTNPPLETIPDNRVYLSPDGAATFVRSFLSFSGGKVTGDNQKADAGEIGRPGETYRRIRITSRFGRMQISVTDGHLPYPFGHEVTGYEVRDFDGTMQRAEASGVKVLSPTYTGRDRKSAILEFPGGYIAEIHSSTVAKLSTSDR